MLGDVIAREFSLSVNSLSSEQITPFLPVVSFGRPEAGAIGFSDLLISLHGDMSRVIDFIFETKASSTSSWVRHNEMSDPDLIRFVKFDAFNAIFRVNPGPVYQMRFLMHATLQGSSEPVEVYVGSWDSANTNQYTALWSSDEDEWTSVVNSGDPGHPLLIVISGTLSVSSFFWGNPARDSLILRRALDTPLTDEHDGEMLRFTGSMFQTRPQDIGEIRCYAEDTNGVLFETIGLPIDAHNSPSESFDVRLDLSNPAIVWPIVAVGVLLRPVENPTVSVSSDMQIDSFAVDTVAVDLDAWFAQTIVSSKLVLDVLSDALVVENIRSATGWDLGEFRAVVPLVIAAEHQTRQLKVTGNCELPAGSKLQVWLDSVGGGGGAAGWGEIEESGDFEITIDLNYASLPTVNVGVRAYKEAGYFSDGDVLTLNSFQVDVLGVDGNIGTYVAYGRVFR